MWASEAKSKKRFIFEMYYSILYYTKIEKTGIISIIWTLNAAYFFRQKTSTSIYYPADNIFDWHNHMIISSNRIERMKWKGLIVAIGLWYHGDTDYGVVKLFAKALNKNWKKKICHVLLLFCRT